MRVIVILLFLAAIFFVVRWGWRKLMLRHGRWHPMVASTREGKRVTVECYGQEPDFIALVESEPKDTFGDRLAQAQSDAEIRAGENNAALMWVRRNRG